MYSFTSPRLAAMLAALLLAGATGAAAAAVKGKKPAGLERYGVAVYSDLCLQRIAAKSAASASPCTALPRPIPSSMNSRQAP